MRRSVRTGLASILCLAAAWPALAFFDLPPLPAPERYGDVLMDRASTAAGEKPVVFSHWSHRVRFTCRVCHYELNFELTAGATDISEEENRNGDFCGACHNGETAFGHTTENCDRCHTGPAVDRKKQFAMLQGKLRPTGTGNEIDWTQAIGSGAIAPRYSLFREEEKPLAFDKRLELAAEWSRVPPAIFDHATHTPWLDCANCHPDIFNIRKKATAHFSMKYILEKKFCGVCHFAVALPIDDCHSCHPGIGEQRRF